MSIKTLREFRYLDAKRKYQRYLREIRLLREQRWEPDASLSYNIFVAPFADVFSALKLTAMDISNSARLVLSTLFAFGDVEKLKKAADSFEDRQSRLRTKWDPIVEKSLEAIRTADPLFTLALGPGAFLATKGVALGLSAGKTAAEIARGEDWDAILTQIRKVPDEKWGLGRLMQQQERQAAESSELTKKLSALFYGATNESRAIHAQPLREQNEDTDKKLPTDPRAWVDAFLEDTGLNEAFDDLASVSAMIRIDLIQGLESVLKKSHAVSALISVKSADEFANVIRDTISVGVLEQGDIKDLNNIMPQIEKQAQELAQSQEFRSSVAAQQDIEPDKLTDAAVKNTAEKVAFNSAKTQFNGQAMAGLDKMMAAVDEIYEKVKIDDETLKMMKQRKDISTVKELADVYENVKRLYDETQATVRKVKGGG